MAKTAEEAKAEEETVYIDAEGRPWKYTTNDQGAYGKYERIALRLLIGAIGGICAPISAVQRRCPTVERRRLVLDAGVEPARSQYKTQVGSFASPQEKERPFAKAAQTPNPTFVNPFISEE